MYCMRKLPGVTGATQSPPPLCADGRAPWVGVQYNARRAPRSKVPPHCATVGWRMERFVVRTPRSLEELPSSTEQENRQPSPKRARRVVEQSSNFTRALAVQEYGGRLAQRFRAHASHVAASGLAEVLSRDGVTGRLPPSLTTAGLQLCLRRWCAASRLFSCPPRHTRSLRSRPRCAAPC
jgi:hypothetical protein